MATPSPACTVQDGGGAVQTNPPFTATAGNTITITLASAAGVLTWTLALAGQDELVTPPTVTVNSVTKIATFTAPTAPWALIYKSQVNNGVDVNGAPQPSFSTTLEIHAKTAGGQYLAASNETQEFSVQFGWTGKINQQIRSPSGTTTTGTGFWHNTAGGLDAAARAINVNSADITGVLQTTNGGTGLSTVGTNGQVLTIVGGVPAWANQGAVSVTGSGFWHNTSGTLDAAASKGTAGQFALTNSGATDIAWTTLTQDVSASTLTVGQITVTGIQTKAVPAPSGTNTVLQWSGSAFSWATVSGGSSVTWASDLVNSTNSNQWVASISGSGGTGGTVALNINNLQFATSQTAPQLSQNGVGPSGGTAQSITIAPQGANATNGTPGNFNVSLANKTGTGAYPFAQVSLGGAPIFQVGTYNNVNTTTALWLLPTGVSATVGDYCLSSNGSDVRLQAPDNLHSIIFQFGDTTPSFFATNVSSSNSINFFGTTVDFGSGTNIIRVGQAGAIPTSGPSNGFLAYGNSGSPGTLGLFSTGIAFHRLAGAILINQDALLTDVPTNNLNINAQDAWNSASTNVNGGLVLIRGGKSLNPGVTGLRGGAGIGIWNSTMLCALEAVVGQRQIGITSNFGSTQMPSGTGDLTVWWGNANTPPTPYTVAPTGGALMWVRSGQFKTVNPDTVTLDVTPAFVGSTGTLNTQRSHWGCLHSRLRTSSTSSVAFLNGFGTLNTSLVTFHVYYCGRDTSTLNEAYTGEFIYSGTTTNTGVVAGLSTQDIFHFWSNAGVVFGQSTTTNSITLKIAPATATTIDWQFFIYYNEC